MSWWIMAYYTSIGYDTGIYNTVWGISQDIPLCPRNIFTFPPDHDVLILNTNVYNDSVCWGLVTKNRGRHCGNIELVVYLVNRTGPVSLVLDLHITHDRFGSSYDPSLHGHLHYPNDINKSQNEDVTDKIRKYRDDYNNNPPITVSFMSVIGSTSGRSSTECVSTSVLHRMSINKCSFDVLKCGIL